MTERCRRPDAADADGYSSPPCFMHELDPVYLGYLSAGEALTLLAELLAAERAGAKAAAAMAATADPALRDALVAVERDGARFCAMLRRHIRRLGGTPGRRTAAFCRELLAAPDRAQQIGLLSRGLNCIAGKLREAIPRIFDDMLREDLRAMLRAHEESIARCAPFAA